MFSLPQIYGFYVPEEIVRMDQAYKPFAMSDAALKAAFGEAKNLRDRLFSDDSADVDDIVYNQMAGEVQGMEKAFIILGVLEEYYEYLRS